VHLVNSGLPSLKAHHSAAIRPTENPAGNQFWVALTGRDLDFHTLSTDKEAFIGYIRKMSGLPTLEFEEFLSFGDFTRVFILQYEESPIDELHRINVRMADKFSKGRVFIAGGEPDR
jgi:hypothetical protein